MTENPVSIKEELDDEHILISNSDPLLLSDVETTKSMSNLDDYFDSIIDSYIDAEIIIGYDNKKPEYNFILNSFDNDIKFRDCIELTEYIEKNSVKVNEFYIFRMKTNNKDQVEFHMRKISDIVDAVYKYHTIRLL
jgi:hypothetical protein